MNEIMPPRAEFEPVADEQLRELFEVIKQALPGGAESLAEPVQIFWPSSGGDLQTHDLKLQRLRRNNSTVLAEHGDVAQVTLTCKVPTTGQYVITTVYELYVDDDKCMISRSRYDKNGHLTNQPVTNLTQDDTRFKEPAPGLHPGISADEVLVLITQLSALSLEDTKPPEKPRTLLDY